MFTEAAIPFPWRQRGTRLAACSGREFLCGLRRWNSSCNTLREPQQATVRQLLTMRGRKKSSKEAELQRDDDVTKAASGREPTAAAAAAAEGSEQAAASDAAGVLRDMPAVLRERPHWYLVQTVPGLEDNVRITLEAKVRNTPSMTDKITQVIVPKLKAMQLSAGGERVEFEEKVFPCYVMVEMVLNEETWEFVRSTAYVVQFVGRDRARRSRAGGVVGGRGLVQPQPLSESEVRRIFDQISVGSSIVSQELKIQAGDFVRVRQGNLAGHEGVVASVSPGRGKLTVNLRWLNRDVPTEFGLEEVEKLDRKFVDLPAPPPDEESEAEPSEESAATKIPRTVRRVLPEDRVEALEALARLDYDWRMLVAMERLDRVPMQALRQYCRAYGLGASGRKVALIERVRQHVIEAIRKEEEQEEQEQVAENPPTPKEHSETVRE